MTIKIVTDEQPRYVSGYILFGDHGIDLEGDTPVQELTSTFSLYESESWERHEVEDYTRRKDNVPEFVKYEEQASVATGLSDGYTSYIAVWWEVTLDG